MADSKTPPIAERWKSVIDHDKEQEENRRDKEKQARREQVYRDADGNSLWDDHVLESSRASQPSRSQQSVGGDDGKYLGQEKTLKANEPAPLPTPPDSPAASKTTVSVSKAFNEMDQHDVEKCRSDISLLQALADSLQSQLEEKEADCERMREELQRVSRQRRNAIRQDANEEVEKLKKREENLNEILEEQEGIVDGLQKRISESKKRERELGRCLAEAESSLEEKDRQLKKSETTVDARKPPYEKGHTVKGGMKSSWMSGDKTWEIRCTKGLKTSSYGVAWDMAKRSLA